MAKLSKKGVSTLLIILILVSLLSLTMFSCTVRLAQNDTYVDMENVHLLQLETPEADDPAMQIETSVGTITAVLYPEEAPNYVAQFTELAEKGYYDGTYVYQVESGAYFRAGSPNEDGSLDDSLDESRQQVEREVSSNLWSFRGAFCAIVTEEETDFLKLLFGSQKTYCGTRFLVCNSIVFDEETKASLEEMDESASAVVDAFLSRGGVPDCSQQMTIFAQAYGKESFSVIDAITGRVAPAGSTPFGGDTLLESDSDKVAPAGSTPFGGDTLLESDSDKGTTTEGTTAVATTSEKNSEPIQIKHITITTWGETDGDAYVPVD